MFFHTAKPVIFFSLLLLAVCCICFSSCRTVKNYPPKTPFVFETNVNVKADLSTDQNKKLTAELEQQLHDSVKTRWVKKFLIVQVLKNPPVFDSINAGKSVEFMKSALNTAGYYRDSINYTVDIDSVKGDQYRTTLNFNLVNAKLFKFDSIAYNLLADTLANENNSAARDTLQKLTEQSLSQSFVKKGEPFSAAMLSQEIGRLTDLYRNNGFFRFSSDEMLVLWDTVGLALLRPTLDPIEQAQQLEQLRLRRLNPTADVEFRLRTSNDTTRLTRYFVGNVTVFPDIDIDTLSYNRTVTMAGEYKFVSYANLFLPQKLTDYIFLHRGDLYRQSNYLKTQNKFNGLSAWRLVTITPYPRPGTDTVDFEIKLSPAKKYQFSANIEGSRNQTPLVTTGNLLGIGVNLSLQNRNFAKGANLAATNLRYGIELDASPGQSTIQTQQYALSHTIQFPRKVPRAIPLFRKNPENVKTIFGLNLAYTDRSQYYTVQSINTSWGYEKSWSNKLLGLRFPNIEYNYLKRQQRLEELIQNNASYKYIFNDGLILSTIANLNIAGGKKNITNLTSFSGEVSGLAASLIPSSFLEKNLYRFARLDAEYRQTHSIRRTAFAWRIFAGLGVSLPTSSTDSANFHLPFFRQYFAGGPNSMRAWAVRRLGPGSSLKSFAPTDAPDRFGDMRLEANAEYRFYITAISGIILNGAVFTDVGNVWFLRKNPDFPDGEFRLNKLWKDIAIGTGTGLRVDFGFLKLRFDYGYKVKNPTPDASNPQEQNKWFYKWQLLNGQFQLGIDYPF